MKFLLLLLFPISLYAQKKGKLVRNQSLKLNMELVGAEWIITATNMNECPSIIEVNMDGISMAYTTPLLKFESFQVSLIPPQIIKFRNTTPCYGGSTDWITMDSKRGVDSINIRPLVSSYKKLTCEKISIPNTIHPPDNDSVVATKLHKIPLPN